MSFVSLLRRRAPAPLMAGLSVESVARSHLGHVRRVNEDRTLDRADRRLWAVADGMGGHAGGGAAAETAVRALAALADRAGPMDAVSVAEALEDANATLVARRGRGGAVSGSTVVALHLSGARATLLWAGDSRAYRLRDGVTEQLTRDHSLVQQLLDGGALTPAEAATDPRGNVVTRALGVDARLELERSVVDVRAGDLFLLCSDGLSRSLAPERLPAMLAGRALAEAADRLLAGALAADGTDNISLVLVCVG